MIVEMFGAPCAGKTTLTNALVARLAETGRNTETIISARPPENSAGAVFRLAKAAACIPTRRPEPGTDLDVVRILLDMFPPKSFFWSVRLRLYTEKLVSSWTAAKARGGVVVVDQAFIQLLCSLSLLGRDRNEHLIGRALDIVPQPDVLVRVDAPAAVLAARLRNRARRQGPFERLLELDVETSLKSLSILDLVESALQRRARRIIRVDGDERALGDGVRRIEEEIAQQERAEAAVRSVAL